jgi:hypothetical protein
MKNLIALLSLLVIAQATGMAQNKNKTDNTPQLIVKGLPDNEYTITPKDYYLFKGCVNQIQITAKDTTRIAEITISNGTIKRTGTAHSYEISELNAGIAMLSIYEKGPKGKKLLVKNKQYTVTDFPKLKYAGVRCDSAISSFMLCGGLFMAQDKETKMRTPVMSFKMDIVEDNQLKIDSTNSNKLSKSMRKYVSGLKTGSLVYMTDIKYKLPDQSVHTVPVFRLFIVNKEGQTVGF